ncbi:WD40 repeat-like protein [Suillus decipiens]|nr:WD40 repeat-like protein [Suillus decipiens]
MASSSMQPSAAEKKTILAPVMTLEGHEPWNYEPPLPDIHELKRIGSISYFPNGKQMISASGDKTIRQWDLREGKEIEKAREVCKNHVEVMEVSRDGRWIATVDGLELKVSEVETGIVRIFYEDTSRWIQHINISADSTLLACVLSSFNANDSTVQIWSLNTGQLVAGPFKFVDDSLSTTLRLSEDSLSRKLAVISSNEKKTVLQVWDVQAQKLNVQKSISNDGYIPSLPVSWTTQDKSIVTAFFSGDPFDGTIYEFDPSTLKTIGAPFKGHTDDITCLVLSPDCLLLASSSSDDTIKLWNFKSRQLLASFDVKSPQTLILSPSDSRQLAYTSWNETNIYICNIPANALASIGLADEPRPSTSKSKHPPHAGLLNFDATPRPVRRKPVIIPVTPISQPLPIKVPYTFLHFLRKFLPSSSHTDRVCTDEHRNPLDFPATSPLPHPLLNRDGNSRSTSAPTTESSVISPSPTLTRLSHLHRPSTWWPFQTDYALPAIIDVPLAPAKLRYATAGAPSNDDGLIRDEDYVSPPPSTNAGQHGSGRFCFCF